MLPRISIKIKSVQTATNAATNTCLLSIDFMFDDSFVGFSVRFPRFVISVFYCLQGSLDNTADHFFVLGLFARDTKSFDG